MRRYLMKNTYNSPMRLVEKDDGTTSRVFFDNAYDSGYGHANVEFEGANKELFNVGIKFNAVVNTNEYNIARMCIKISTITISEATVLESDGILRPISYKFSDKEQLAVSKVLAAEFLNEAARLGHKSLISPEQFDITMNGKDSVISGSGRISLSVGAENEYINVDQTNASAALTAIIDGKIAMSVIFKARFKKAFNNDQYTDGKLVQAGGTKLIQLSFQEFELRDFTKVSSSIQSHNYQVDKTDRHTLMVMAKVLIEDQLESLRIGEK